METLTPSPLPTILETTGGDAFSWITFLASVAASSISGLILFVFGQRAAKAQVDRVELKERYRELLIHFEGLLKRLRSGDPMRYRDFQRRDVRHPLTVNLEAQGRLYDLPEGSSLRELEGRTLNYGRQFHIHLDSLWPTALNLLEDMASVDLIRQGGRIKTPHPQSWTSVSRPFGAILLPDVYERTLHEVRASRSNSEFAFELHYADDDGNGKSLSALTPYVPEGLDAYLVRLRSVVMEGPGTEDLMDRRAALLSELEAMKRLLSRRVKEPHTLWETVRASFRDIANRN